MDNPVNVKIRINELYDAYGTLLAEKQRRYVEYYYHDDYSLAEIATLSGVSRTAVHEQIGMAVEHLETFEAALGLVRMKKAARALVRRLGELGIQDAELSRLSGEIEETE